jgi:hypothetical protein
MKRTDLRIEIPMFDIPALIKEAEASQRTNRCQMGGCKKKLDLTAFPCRCEGFYCPAHRGDAAHGCTYDYKSKHQAYLSSSMEKIGTKLVDKI